MKAAGGYTFLRAGCVHFNTKCYDDDAHIAIENDFVLLLPNGKHYFLPNLNRAIKARYVAKPVQISGNLEGHEIWVDRLDVKKGNKYTNVWSWKEQQELYKGGGGQYLDQILVEGFHGKRFLQFLETRSNLENLRKTPAIGYVTASTAWSTLTCPGNPNYFTFERPDSSSGLSFYRTFK